MKFVMVQFPDLTDISKITMNETVDVAGINGGTVIMTGNMPNVTPVDMTQFASATHKHSIPSATGSVNVPLSNVSVTIPGQTGTVIVPAATSGPAV